MRDRIRFLRRGRIVERAAEPPTRTLLDYLRLDERSFGTKEGCAEGDCGACAVVLGRRGGDGVRYESVTSCICLLGQADGAELVAVEDLAQDGRLHPVQQAMVDRHGSQCGFCTPGFVMSLFALHHRPKTEPLDRKAVNDALAGNLCRCTGYRPIVDAALDACAAPPDDAFSRRTAETVAKLAELDDGEDVFMGSQDRFLAAPASIESLATLYAAHPDATLVAGATDVGLWITKGLRDLSKVILLGRARGLDDINETSTDLSLGATVTHSVAMERLGRLHPDLRELWRRFGSEQVRALGTIGGNIANGSPIGDAAPALIALGAILELQQGDQIRSLGLEDFFLGYGKQDRRPGEFVRRIVIRKPRAGETFRCFKISKRIDEDISAVMGAFRFSREGRRARDVRIAYGGMAATPKRALRTEAVSIDFDDEKTLSRLFAALESDFQPIDDHRASAAYRMSVAKALLEKAFGRREDVVLSRPPARTASTTSGFDYSGLQDHPDQSVVHKPYPHDSATKHVTGAAIYVDDIPEPAGTLHIGLGLAPIARGRLTGLDLSAVANAPGIVAVLTAADIPGANDVSPTGAGDDPIFAVKDIDFHGQILFAVAAETRDAARRAARLATIETQAETPILDVAAARAADMTILPDYDFIRGDVEDGLAQSSLRLDGALSIGGQEHFYLEGQVSLAIPGEDGDMIVHCSTQHPSEVQHAVAHALDLPMNAVTVEVRRMGGGFGGKESQAAQWAVIAALAARKTGRACKIRLDRDEDMILTGKRHEFDVEHRVGFREDGRIEALDLLLAARCGASMDLSSGVVDRAMFHADNAYFLPAAAIRSKRLKTNTVSNTAFRGFGAPQGVLAIENVLDDIAFTLRRDPLDVRKKNFYSSSPRDVTPYGMTVHDNILLDLVETLETRCDYRERRRAIDDFNASGGSIRKGIALTPVKFGVSFTLSHLNQAGALVHVYTDGSVHLNHGGTEMGQGLFTKVAQVVAEEFGIGLDQVKITATHTGKTPNTAPTAASSGSDLNGMAARAAAGTIKERLIDFASAAWEIPKDRIVFRDGRVLIGNESITFGELAKKAFLARVSLSSTGFYKTPKVHWDRAKAQGRPFFYFAYGAACSETTIDVTTGEMRLDRVDILHDVGRSLNPAIDMGQIEGAFVQGMGWLTNEELVWDAQGRLRTHAPSTYKIPVAGDIPADFRTAFYESGGAREETIYRSKAVGEPPLMLAVSVFSSIRSALASLSPGCVPPLRAPATPEAILAAATAMRSLRPSAASGSKINGGNSTNL